MGNSNSSRRLQEAAAKDRAYQEAVSQQAQREASQRVYWQLKAGARELVEGGPPYDFHCHEYAFNVFVYLLCTVGRVMEYHIVGSYNMIDSMMRHHIGWRQYW